MTGCLAGLVCSVPAFAQSESASMPVSGQVVNRCGVRATPMDFGTINPRRTGPIDATATVTVRCTVFQYVQIRMDNGQNAIGNQRRMVNGSGEFIEYNVYLNAARTFRWGPAPGGYMLAGNTAGISDIGLTAYGRIDALPAGVNGAYSDVVTVSVIF
ncbi:Csu type fimbrial protein [Pontixanthobacter sp.]|uniref:Csu type fimbrial protein n=1 Tax=Pontixanthobacter sp. TaxID=2792078 RepID=UPI003C79D36D